MEYIDQIEKLYNYLECNLQLYLVRSVFKLKHNFNNDCNLLGCFLKDYLTIKNYEKTVDEYNLCEEFISYFEAESSKLPSEYIINDMIKFGNYYLSIVFEDIRNSEISIAASTINSCFAIEYYPILMKIMDKFYSNSITERKLKILSESLVDVVIHNYEQAKEFSYTNDELEKQVHITAKEKAGVLSEIGV